MQLIDITLILWFAGGSLVVRWWFDCAVDCLHYVPDNTSSIDCMVVCWWRWCGAPLLTMRV